MKHLRFLPQLIALSFFFLSMPGTAQPADNKALLQSINTQLEKAQSPTDKSKYFVFRARYHRNYKHYEKAIEDYGYALTLNHQSWIHLERAALLINLQEYQLAREEALAAKSENPGHAPQADQLITRADNELRQIHNRENPQDIVLNREIDSSRRTRFDLPWNSPLVVQSLQNGSGGSGSKSGGAKVVCTTTSTRKS